MYKDMTDKQLKEGMKNYAKIAGLNLTKERIEKDLSIFRAFLSAIEKFSAVAPKLEDEPIPVFRLKKQQKRSKVR